MELTPLFMSGEKRNQTEPKVDRRTLGERIIICRPRGLSPWSSIAGRRKVVENSWRCWVREAVA